MLNIDHLLMKQRYFALEEISTVFLAIGFAQYTIYHFKYRKYKNSAIAKVIDYEEKYYDSDSEKENHLEFPSVLREFEDEYIMDLMKVNDNLEK